MRPHIVGPHLDPTCLQRSSTVIKIGCCRIYINICTGILQPGQIIDIRAMLNDATRLHVEEGSNDFVGPNATAGATAGKDVSYDTQGIHSLWTFSNAHLSLFTHKFPYLGV